MGSKTDQERLTHELRELREKHGFKRNNEKRPGRENNEEELRFFAAFAQFVVSLSFTCLAVVVFAQFV
jgi:hypothetical protein